MELTVFGATGGTGGHVVQQALEAGHRVTAVVRDPARFAVGPRDGLRVVTVAALTDPEALRPALEGRDAVLSAVGARSPRWTGIASAGTESMLRALDACGVRRFLAVSAAPVGPTPEGEGLLNRTVITPLVRAALRAVYADLARMEEAMRASSAEWTAVRPPRLTDRPVTGSYRRAVGGNVPNGRTISRADLAHAMLAMVDDPAVVGQAVGVAY